MRILLTGVGGNIGRGLVDRLTDQGEHDLVLTDLIRPAWLRPERYGQVAFTALDVQIGGGHLRRERRPPALT